MEMNIASSTEPSARSDVNVKYECGWCEGSFKHYTQILAHIEDEHPKMDVAFYEIGSKSKSLSFLSSEFCAKVSGYYWMKKYLLNQDQNGFVCELCGRNYATLGRITNHFRVKHNGQPVHVVRVSDLYDDLESQAYTQNITEGFSFYGTTPEKVDLSNIKISVPIGFPENFLSPRYLMPTVNVDDFRK